MNQKDMKRLEVLNGIADLWVKNAFAIAVLLVFIGSSTKLIFYTDKWPEMSSIGAFNVIVMWVLKYYFPRKEKNKLQ